MRFNKPWQWFTNLFSSPKIQHSVILGKNDASLSLITIGKDGTHELLVGTTRYGKGCVPNGGHKPQTIIELEGGNGQDIPKPKQFNVGQK